MARHVVWMLAFGLLVSGCAAGGAAPSRDRIATDPDLAARVDAVAARAFEELPLAGMTVAVAHGGTISLAAGYGEADVSLGIPADAGTVYPIGSISKQFTAATVLRLAEQGALSLDDPVADHVPVPDSDPPPTVRQLLSHTSGVTDVRLGPALQASGDGVGMSWDDAIDLATEPGYWTAPGSGFEYSNGGFLLAYGVVEQAAGQPYRSQLEQLLADAALHETAVCDGTVGGGVAQGYRQQYDLWSRVGRLGRPPGLQLAPGYNPDLLDVVCATAPDLVRWAHRLRAGEVVSDESYRTMVTPTTLTDGSVVAYGLGVQRRRFGDHLAVAHGGILTGYVAMLADFPEDDTTVALLVNTDLEEHQTGTLLQHLLGAVFDESPTQGWLPDLGGGADR